MIVSKKEFSDTQYKYLYFGVLISFIILATVISSEFSRDSGNYNRMFERYGATGWDALFSEIFRHEVFVLVSSKVLYQLGVSSVFLFIIHAAISLSVKFYLIDKYSRDKWLSLAFFSSYFFILHDSTQIRFSMAVAFVYLGLSYLADGKKLLFSVTVIFSAILFHISSIIFIAMLFFTSRKSLAWLLGLLLLAVLLYPVSLNLYLLDIINGVIRFFDFNDTFFNKFNRLYLKNPESDGYFGLFNWRVLLVYFCAIVIFQYRNVFSKYELLCYNALLLSIFVYIFAKDIVEIQYRISGLFGFSLVFLVPYIHQWLSEHMSKRNAYIILISFLTAYLLKFSLYDKMIII